MFDIGFSELVVIGVVGLVVIGPERLPRVARTVGALIGRAQRYFNQVKDDVNRELRVDEMRKMQEQVMAEARAIDTSVADEVRRVDDSLHQVSRDIEHSVALDAAVQTPVTATQPPNALPPNA